jgi:hypothetical protein
MIIVWDVSKGCQIFKFDSWPAHGVGGAGIGCGGSAVAAFDFMASPITSVSVQHYSDLDQVWRHGGMVTCVMAAWWYDGMVE